MLQKSYQFVRGTLRIEVTGSYPERFLNVCSRSGIPFWDLEPVDVGKFRVNVYASDFSYLHRFAAKCKCRARILEKKGLRFTARRARPRSALLAGAVLFFLLYVSFSNFIWTFEVTGCETVSPVRVLSVLRQEGVYPGVLASDVHPEALRNRALLKLQELSWLTVTVQGTHAVVDVRERIEKPTLVDPKLPCDVVATESGLVESVIARAGQPVKKQYDLVEAGDILISHSVPITYSEESRTVHARGEVYARVWHTVKTATPLSVVQKHSTGKETQRWSLILGTNRINFFINSGNPYQECDKIINRYDLTLGSLRLPVSLQRETYREYEIAVGVTDMDTAKAVSEDAALTLLSDLSGRESEPLSKDASTENGVLYTTVTTESIVQIGKSVPVATP